MHWLTWPSIFFALQTLVYVYFFSSHGHLQNIVLKEEGKVLEARVIKIKKDIHKLEKKLSHIKLSGIQKEKIMEELDLHESNMMILNF